eukprot:724839-Rhodomonas_salina.1
MCIRDRLYSTDKDMSKAALCDFESVCRTAPPGSPSWGRWQQGWEPLRWTEELLHPQHESVEPRQIDLYALAQVLRENAAPSPLLLSLGLSNSSEQQDTRKRAAEVPIGSGVAEEEDVEGREHQAVDAEERSSERNLRQSVRERPRELRHPRSVQDGQQEAQPRPAESYSVSQSALTM